MVSVGGAFACCGVVLSGSVISVFSFVCLRRLLSLILLGVGT